MTKNWTPIQTGDAFCSPACGRQCKREWFDAATQTAARMAIELGEPFRPHVHENLGWFSSAFADLGNGITIRVSPNHDPTGSEEPRYYTADLKTPRGRQFYHKAATATEAVRMAVNALRVFADAVYLEADRVEISLPDYRPERPDYRAMVSEAWEQATATGDEMRENACHDATITNAVYLTDWRQAAIDLGLVGEDAPGAGLATVLVADNRNKTQRLMDAIRSAGETK